MIGGWGGLERYPLVVHDLLKQKGFEVFVLTTYHSELHIHCQQIGIPVFTVLKFQRFSLPVIRKMKQILREYKIDIIHCRKSREIYNWYFALTSFPNVKFVVSFHTGVPDKRNFFHKWFYKRVNKIIAISDYYAGIMRKKLPVSADKIIKLYNGVDLNKFKIQSSKGKFRKEYKISQKDLVFTGIGNIIPGKGVEEFIKAAGILNKKYSCLTFIWVGHDLYSSIKDYKQKLVKIVNNSGLKNRFIFTGYRNDIPTILNDSDIFILPSYHEAFGNVYIEAMACGLPVIGYDTSNTKEIIFNAQNGFLVKPGDSLELASTMEKYINNRKLIRKHGNKGLQISKKFSLLTHIKNLVKIYNEKA